MTRMAKNEVYDELTRVLTNWEHPEDHPDIELSPEYLYDMLVKIQNNWEELTGEDE